MQDNRPTDSREEVDFRKLLEAAIANPEAVYALFDLPVVKTRINIIGKFSTDNVADAEELPLAVLFKVLDNITRFEPDFEADKYGMFLRWVGVIARNVIRDNLRRKKIKVDVESEEFEDLVDPGIGPELAAERAEHDRNFRAFIANIQSPRDRKILEYALEDLSAREAKAKLNAAGIPCSHTTVCNVIKRYLAMYFANEDLYFLPRKPVKPSSRGGEPEDKPADKRTDAK